MRQVTPAAKDWQFIGSIGNQTMSRTPARFTQADVARTIRAAKQAGAGAVELLPDGTIRIRLDGLEKPAQPVEPDPGVVL